jgi:hypothetical protein
VTSLRVAAIFGNCLIWNAINAAADSRALVFERSAKGPPVLHELRTMTDDEKRYSVQNNAAWERFNIAFSSP